MAWIYEALEIYDKRDQPLGKFRVGRWQDTGSVVQGLCNHVHDSREEALSCPTAQKILDAEFQERWATPTLMLENHLSN